MYCHICFSYCSRSTQFTWHCHGYVSQEESTTWIPANQGLEIPSPHHYIDISATVAGNSIDNHPWTKLHDGLNVFLPPM